LRPAGQQANEQEKGAEMARRASRLTGGAAAGRAGGGDAFARPRDGIITGYLLKLIRQSTGLSQEGLAEQVGVDSNTVQGWETGRRSLTGTRVATLVELRHRLRQLGADPQLVGALEDAAEADYVLAYTLGNEPGAAPPGAHPLACWVPKRSFAYLLAWPFTGQPPIALRPPLVSTRRGPVAPAPVLTQEERRRFFEHLRAVAEHSLGDRRLNETRGTLLRRNVYYSLSWNPNSEATAWLSELEQHEARRLGLFESWSPSWTAARSLVVARARRGDKEPLRQFIATALNSDACQAANLNYWAYWIGEVPETYSSDEFMAGDLGPWSGAALLRRLVANLVASEPLADLYAHSLWALLERRGRLLEADPQLAGTLAGWVEVLLAEGDLSGQSRRELEQVHYGVRLLR
jgi:transcriptional regulator with XRE-family HTH domain